VGTTLTEITQVAKQGYTSIVMKFLVLISTILCASTVAKDNRRRNPGPFFVASRGSTQGIRRLQGDKITSDVPDVDFTLNFDTSSTGGVCSTGCEGDYEEIQDAMELLENQGQEYEFFFKVKGRFAVGAGVIFDNFADRVEDMIDSNPQVDTLILVYVPGSANDEVAVIGDQLIYEKGISTCVPSDGYTASGGTDLFVSGFNRYATEGAKIGIHSWDANPTKGATIGIHSWAAGDYLVGSELPRDHPIHTWYLDFSRAVCIPDDFYWETLSHGLPMYYVTEEEIDSKFKYFRDCNGECEPERRGPSPTPTDLPTSGPTSAPTATPTDRPTSGPTSAPTATSTDLLTSGPTSAPIATPTDLPTSGSTSAPIVTPTDLPTSGPNSSAPRPVSTVLKVAMSFVVTVSFLLL
jgi:hypothetical protein